MRCCCLNTVLLQLSVRQKKKKHSKSNKNIITNSEVSLTSQSQFRNIMCSCNLLLCTYKTSLFCPNCLCTNFSLVPKLQFTMLIPGITACIWCHIHEKYGKLFVFLISLVTSLCFGIFLKRYQPLFYSGVLGEIFKFNSANCFIIYHKCMFVLYGISFVPHAYSVWNFTAKVLLWISVTRTLHSYNIFQIVHTASYTFYSLRVSLLMKIWPRKLGRFTLSYAFEGPEGK